VQLDHPVRDPRRPQVRVADVGARQAEPLHVETVSDRIDHDPRPVHDDREARQLRRDRQAEHLEPLLAVVVGVRALQRRLGERQLVLEVVEPSRLLGGQGTGHGETSYRKTMMRLSCFSQPSARWSAAASCASTSAMSRSIFWFSDGLPRMYLSPGLATLRAARAWSLTVGSPSCVVTCSAVSSRNRTSASNMRPIWFVGHVTTTSSPHVAAHWSAWVSQCRGST